MTTPKDVLGIRAFSFPGEELADDALTPEQEARQCPKCLKWFMTRKQRDAHVAKRHSTTAEGR